MLLGATLVAAVGAEAGAAGAATFADGQRCVAGLPRPPA